MHLTFVAACFTLLSLTCAAQGAASATAKANEQAQYVLEECQETESSNSPSVFNGIDPAGMLKIYLERYRSKRTRAIDLSSIEITLLEGARHGKVITEFGEGGSGYYYDPVPNYVGKDRAVFLATAEGVRYKIIVNLVVNTGVNENPRTSDMPPVCHKPRFTKTKNAPR